MGPEGAHALYNNDLHSEEAGSLTRHVMTNESPVKTSFSGVGGFRVRLGSA